MVKPKYEQWIKKDKDREGEKEAEWTDEQREKFIAWLKNEMHKRWWNWSDLAREGKITSGALSHMANGTRGLGPRLATGIARALEIPEAIVFEEAGLLPKQAVPRDELAAQIEKLWSKWSTIERAHFLQMMLDYDRALTEERDRKSRGGSSRQPRDSLRVEGKAAQPGLGL